MTKEEFHKKWKEKLQDPTTTNKTELWADMVICAVENSEKFEFVDIEEFFKKEEKGDNV